MGNKNPHAQKDMGKGLIKERYFKWKLFLFLLDNNDHNNSACSDNENNCNDDDGKCIEITGRSRGGRSVCGSACGSGGFSAVTDNGNGCSELRVLKDFIKTCDIGGDGNVLFTCGSGTYLEVKSVVLDLNLSGLAVAVIIDEVNLQTGRIECFVNLVFGMG